MRRAGGTMRRCGQAALLTAGMCVGGGALASGACATSSTGIAFGSYQPLVLPGRLTSDDRTSTATISIVCNAIAAGGSYTVSLGPSSYGSGDRISMRALNNMGSAGDLMVFNVYTSSNYDTVWGDGTIGVVLTGSIPVGDSNQSRAVYGRVPGGQQTLKAGTYADSMVMTITYNP